MTPGDERPLESPWIWRTLLLVTVGLIAWWCWRAVRHRRRGHDRTPVRRWATRTGLGLLTAVLVAATAAAYANTVAGYLPDLGALGRLVGGQPARITTPGPRGGRLDVIDIPAPDLQIPTGRTFVWLPPGYDAPGNATRRYPVVYLVHGWPGRSADWFEAGGAGRLLDRLVGHGTLPPMILVGVDATAGTTDDTECLDTDGGPRVETYLTGTVVDRVDARYRTSPDPQHRAIGGMSMGGYCALNLGLKHADRYGTILACLPYGDPDPAASRRLRPERVVANSPSLYIPKLTLPRALAVLLSVGGNNADDVRVTQQLAHALRARGQRVELRVEKGQGHTWHAARAALPHMLTFAAREAGPQPSTPPGSPTGTPANSAASAPR